MDDFSMKNIVERESELVAETECKMTGLESIIVESYSFTFQPEVMCVPETDCHILINIGIKTNAVATGQIGIDFEGSIIEYAIRFFVGLLLVIVGSKIEAF